ncbi:hypothetical protein H5410_051032 [Solanum commersonii]|uniref:Uncharacterized protein n=1 Tax=Solanum commersonii TaxID=4109 RepID=A0A9J5WYS8_SOLCO|nr:hypothetical protein H5410_051032 [Solanum commersonii]
MCCDGPFGERLASSNFESLGDMVLPRETVWRHVDYSISSPTFPFPSGLSPHCSFLRSSVHALPQTPNPES